MTFLLQIYRLKGHCGSAARPVVAIVEFKILLPAVLCLFSVLALFYGTRTQRQLASVPLFFGMGEMCWPKKMCWPRYLASLLEPPLPHPDR